MALETAILQIFFNSIALGLMFGLVGLGLSLLRGVLKLIDVSQAVYYLLAGYITYFLGVTFGLPLPLVLAIAMVIGFGLGAIIERGLLEPRGLIRNSTNVMMITTGIAIAAEQFFTIAFGSYYRTIPSIVPGVFELFGYFVQLQQIVGGLFALALAGGVYLILKKTKLGIAIRLVAFDRDFAQMLGVNASRIALLTYAIGGALSSAPGVFLTAVYVLHPSLLWNITTLAFVVVILGGEGSLSGTLLAGIAYAFALNIASYFVPQLSTVIGLLMIILVLVLHPSGFRGKLFVERA